MANTTVLVSPERTAVEGVGPELLRTGEVRGQGFGRRWMIAAALFGLLLIGGALRFDQLGARGMGHVESYTPGLPFPPNISSPEPRLTLARAISGPMFEEPHPPAWYAAMWPWTRVFGTDIVTIRIPSVAFGVASIALIYWLGRLAHGWQTGLIAAALLALNGHHLLFSQVARPTSMAVCLSILSTVLLLLMTRQGITRRRLILALYLGVTLVGMATLYYFWPILAAQMLWVALRGAASTGSIGRILRWQWLLVILGSPLLTLAIFQQFNSFLEADGLGIIGQFLEFGFLFEPDNFGVLSTQAYIPDIVRAALPVACLALIALGLRRTRWSQAAPVEVDVPPLQLRALAASAGLAFGAIALETAFFEHHRPGRLGALLVSSALPIAIFFGLFVAPRVPGVTSLRQGLQPVARFVGNKVGLMYVMTAVPVALIACVSLFIPFFASRHMLLFTPYLLIIIARGITELFNISRSRLARVAVAGLVAGFIVVHISSIAYSRDRLVTLVDYRGLANQWIPNILPGDVILVQPHWATTPIFYYLDCARFACIGSDYTSALDTYKPRRVWALSFNESKNLAPELGQALAGFSHVRDIDAPKIHAELFTPE